MYKRKTDVLEDKVRADMERLNLEAGFERFRYLGSSKRGPYWEMRYLYRPQRTIGPSEISYGGYPFVSKLSLLKAYLEDC